MAEPPGFILLSRDLLTKSVFRGDPDILKLWIYILLRCNYSDKGYTYGGVTVGRGQFLRSYRQIARDCASVVRGKTVEWSPGKVKRMLDSLVKAGRIRIIPHGEENLGTLYEVVNWDKRQKIGSFTRAEKPKSNGVDRSSKLWEVWLEELAGSGPKPSLTHKRKQALNALYEEQLATAGGDPAVLFRGMVRTLKASDHHMSNRAYQMPESFLRNPERRESWYLRSLEGQSNPQEAQAVSLEDLWRDDE